MAEIKTGMIDWNSVFKDVSWFHWTELLRQYLKAAEVCFRSDKSC